MKKKHKNKKHKKQTKLGFTKMTAYISWLRLFILYSKPDGSGFKQLYVVVFFMEKKNFTTDLSPDRYNSCGVRVLLYRLFAWIAFICLTKTAGFDG